MASDKFEVGDILVCMDGSAHGGFGEGLQVGKIYEVERPNGSECYLVGSYKSWFCRRFRRATLAEIRKYRKEQGYEKHQFAIGELVVCLVDDYRLTPSIGTTHVVSATRSDYEHECFIDIDGGEAAGRFFAACFRKATPAEAAAYRKANEPPKKGKRLFYNLDSIETAEVGDLVVFRRDFNVPYLDGGARIIDAIAKDGNGKVTSLKVRNPKTGDWAFTDPDYWVPVGKGYELVALGQPIQPGDQWLEYGKWMTTDLEGCFPADELVINGSVHPLRRKVKDAVTVQIGDKPPFKAVDVTPFTPTATPEAAFTVSFEWKGPEKMPLTGNDSPEAISKAISLPNPQCLTSADGREFDIIDWNPKVKTGEIVTVEANLLPKLAKEKSKSLADGLVGAVTPKKPQWEPKAGDIVVCLDPPSLIVPWEGSLVRDKAYRIESLSPKGSYKVEGVSQFWCRSRFRLATPAEAQAFLNAEKQPPKEPGIGYRFLDKEELVVEGDEFWIPSGRAWKASDHWRPSQDKTQAGSMTYRRRNQFAEGELVQIIKPATQALRDREPKWRDAMDHLDGKVFEMPNVVWCDGWRSVPLFRRGSCTHFQPVHLNWLAPASSKQKAAFQAEKDKKAKVQELEDKMKAIESELAILKGT